MESSDDERSDIKRQKMNSDDNANIVNGSIQRMHRNEEDSENAISSGGRTVLREFFELAHLEQLATTRFKRANYTLPPMGYGVTFDVRHIPRILEMPSAEDVKTGMFNCRPGKWIKGRYEMKEIIGRGVFAVVVRASDVISKSDVALKIINNHDEASGTIEAELNALQKCYQSRFIINLIDDLGTDNHRCLVLPLMQRNLYEFMMCCDCKVPISFSNTKDIGYQVISAVEYLAVRNMVHSDIKPENILLTDCKFSHIEEMGRPVRSLRNPSILLTDLNTIYEGSNEHSEFAQTMSYRAPEVILGNGWTHKVDVFSVGLLMYEMITCETLVVDIEDYAWDNMVERPLHLCHLVVAIGPIPVNLFEKSPIITIDSYLKAMGEVSELQRVMKLSSFLVAKGCPSNEVVFNLYQALRSLLALDCSQRCSAGDALKLNFFKDSSFKFV